MTEIVVILVACFVVALLAPFGAAVAFLGGGVLIAIALALLILGIRATASARSLSNGR